MQNINNSQQYDPRHLASEIEWNIERGKKNIYLSLCSVTYDDNVLSLHESAR